MEIKTDEKILSEDGPMQPQSPIIRQRNTEKIFQNTGGADGDDGGDMESFASGAMKSERYTITDRGKKEGSIQMNVIKEIDEK